jgi:hypothetical protein
MKNIDEDIDRVLKGNFDISYFYSDKNPTSYVNQVNKMLYDYVRNSELGKDSVDSAMQFSGYARMIQMFTSCLTCMENFHPDTIDKKRAIEISQMSKIPIHFIESHIDFFVKAKMYVQESIRKNGKIKDILEFNRRFDKFIEQGKGKST